MSRGNNDDLPSVPTCM